MARKAQAPEVEVNEVEVDETEETQAIRPNDLAKELGVDGKRIRAYLRQNFTRPDEAKNSSWILSDDQVAAVRERFTPKAEGEDEDSDEE